MFTLIMAYFVFERWHSRSRIFSWSIILSFCLYTLTTICWACDVWNLWVELYLAIPAELLPSRADADKAAYVRQTNMIQDIQNLLTPIVVSVNRHNLRRYMRADIVRGDFLDDNERHDNPLESIHHLRSCALDSCVACLCRDCRNRWAMIAPKHRA